LDYKVPVYGRNLVNDLNSLTERTVTTLSKPTRARVRDLATSLGGYWRYAGQLDKLDTYDQDDARPHRKDMQLFKKNLNARIASRIPPLLRAQTRQEVQDLERFFSQNGPGVRIAVLCRGNICRSPFAAYLLEQRAQQRRLDMEVVQAGTLPRGKRPSPANAVEAAQAFGIDLEPHRSTHISALDVSEIDLIVHFDPLIEQELHRVVREVPCPIFNLAHLAPRESAAAVIEDPVGQSVAVFTQTYRQIDIALDRFLDKAAFAWQQPASAA
ncbi:MAG: hypothetical protein AAF337_06290, partial [Pseudomonadota bacterium]